MERKLVTQNKTAFHNYQILDKYEAGIVLTGCEIKSIRENRVNLKDGFARVVNGELFLFNCHISPYMQGNRFNGDPTRDRKLLMHRAQINKLIGKIEEKGLTLVPLCMFFLNNHVKVELALAQSKKMYDKRQDLKEKAIKKDLERTFRYTNNR